MLRVRAAIDRLLKTSLKVLAYAFGILMAGWPVLLLLYFGARKVVDEGWVGAETIFTGVLQFAALILAFYVALRILGWIAPPIAKAIAARPVLLKAVRIVGMLVGAAILLLFVVATIDRWTRSGGDERCVESRYITC